MKVLCIDTATESATCAVIDDNKLLGEITVNYRKQHSVIMMNIINDLLSYLKLNINSIDGFVVSKGPGSFTGLRIGAATVKGLCTGTNKPFVSVSSLQALAYSMAFTNGVVCPIMDALRGNVYTNLFSFDKDQLKELSSEEIISMDDLLLKLEDYRQPICFIGDAIDKFKSKILLKFPNALFAPSHLNVVKASSLGAIGIELLKASKEDNIYSFSPNYMMKSQAEREYENKIRNDKVE